MCFSRGVQKICYNCQKETIDRGAVERFMRGSFGMFSTDNLDRGQKKARIRALALSCWNGTSVMFHQPIPSLKIWSDETFLTEARSKRPALKGRNPKEAGFSLPHPIVEAYTPPLVPSRSFKEPLDYASFELNASETTASVRWPTSTYLRGLSTQKVVMSKTSLFQVLR